MKWTQLFVIYGAFCCILGDNVTTVNEVPINELITDGIIDPSKQWQSNPFFVYLQSWFGGASPNVAPADDCPQCSCGKTNPDGRVFGGDETGVNEYPWMAILLYNNEFFCGGSLINDRFVLTAAECVDDKQGTMQNIIVRLLEHDRSMDNETTLIDRQVKSITINPKFNKTSHDSDIALIEFTEPVKFQDNLRPVCLPESDFDYDDSTGNVTGWGGLSDESSSNVLKQFEVRIMSNKRCQRSDVYGSKMTDNMLCARPLTAVHNKGFLTLDKGGPLQSRNQTAFEPYELAGIVSWNEMDREKTTIGVYSRVSKFLKWINEKTTAACKCSTK